MNRDGLNRTLHHIVSPYGLAILSYAFFLSSCLIPPTIYSDWMHEPDWMFLDPTTILFYSLCVGAFLAGVWFFETLFPSLPSVEHKLEVSFNAAAFLLIPLLLCTAVSALSCVLIVKNNPLLIPLLALRQAYVLEPGSESGVQLEGTLNIAVLFLTGVIWWVAWRVRCSDVTRGGKRAVYGALAIAVLVVFASSSLMLSRHSSVVLVGGLGVIYLLGKLFANKLRWRVIGKIALLYLTGGAFFFFLVEWLKRGSTTSKQPPGFAFVGYTFSSYNRLAAVLQGRLRFDYAGRGIFFSNFLSFNHSLNHMIPFGRTIHAPEFFDWWRASFASVGRAGLDFRMIFIGAFGELYSEIGWLAPVCVFGYGLLYGLVWRWMKAGKVAGILLYPYFAYCTLFWFSTNGLFDQDLVALVIDALLLGLFESLFVRQSNRLVAASQVA